jgi:hypothetical protein
VICSDEADRQSLNLPGQDPIPLEAHGTGTPSELYSYTDGQLEPVGSAAGRLSVPFTAGATFRAAEKMAQKNVALERQRAQRAERVTGKPVAAASYTARPVEASNFHASPIPSHVPMARTQSGPAATSMTMERIPLKTRVVQHLALGPSTMQGIVDTVGGEMSDIVRTVNVVSCLCSQGTTLTIRSARRLAETLPCGGCALHSMPRSRFPTGSIPTTRSSLSSPSHERRLRSSSWRQMTGRAPSWTGRRRRHLRLRRASGRHPRPSPLPRPFRRPSPLLSPHPSPSLRCLPVVPSRQLQGPPQRRRPPRTMQAAPKSASRLPRCAASMSPSARQACPTQRARMALRAHASALRAPSRRRPRRSRRHPRRPRW